MRICARGPIALAMPAALAEAVAIRKLFDGKPLVPGIKMLLAHIHGDPQWARVEPPLSAFPAADRAAVIAGYDAVRAKRGRLKRREPLGHRVDNMRRRNKGCRWR